MIFSQERLGGSTSSGVQNSNPLRSNSSNNFSCLCFTISFGTWGWWASSDASIKSVCTSSSGTHMTTTALATGVFFLRVWGYAILFLIHIKSVSLRLLNMLLHNLHTENDLMTFKSKLKKVLFMECYN